jgi:hypothetical protein
MVTHIAMGKFPSVFLQGWMVRVVLTFMDVTLFVGVASLFAVAGIFAWGIWICFCSKRGLLTGGVPGTKKKGN